MKALASAVLCLFGYALCFLPLRKLPLALFAVIVFPYLRDKKTSKSCYDSLRQFDLTGFSSDFRLFFHQRQFPFPKRKARPTGGRNIERVSCYSRRGRLSVRTENGADQFVFQTAFHVLIQAGMGTVAFVVDRPGAELVYVALVVPQDLLHSVSIPGLGRVAHRQRQQFTALIVPALYGANLLSSLSASPAGHSAILFCAAGRHSGTIPRPHRSRCLSNPAPGAKSKCFAPAPADRQRHRPPVGF